MSAEDLTRQGIAAHRAGDIATATDRFVRAVQADPRYEMAWLWLASSLSDPAERRYCLERALAANPQSQPAQTGLARLPSGAARVPGVLAGPVEAPAEFTGVGIAGPGLATSAANTVDAPKKKGVTLRGVIITAVLAVVLVVGGLFFFAGPFPGQEARLVATASEVLVARDDAAFNTVLRAVQANDEEAVLSLVAEDRVIFVQTGTRVRVLDRRDEWMRVQILDGTYAGRSGLVMSYFVRR